METVSINFDVVFLYSVVDLIKYSGTILSSVGTRYYYIY